MVAATLCAGCAPLPPPQPPHPEPTLSVPAPAVVYVPTDTQQDQALELLQSYQAALLRLPQSEWPKEAGKLGDGQASIADAMKLALLLSHTHAGGDIQRAQALLDKVAATTSEDALPWHRLARMLSALLSERRRQEEQIDKLQQQMRDSQRDNQRKLDQLNEKLEALKSIERSLNNRAPSLPLQPASAPLPPQTPASPAATQTPGAKPVTRP